MLDTSKAPRFQCFGFSVSRNNPIATVPKVFQEIPLRRALADKILLDVTNSKEAAGIGNKVLQEIDKAVSSGNILNLGDQEVGPKILIGKDSRGNSYVIIPKDEEDLLRMQEEIKINGFVRREKPRATEFSGLSAMYEEDLPPIDSQV